MARQVVKDATDRARQKVETVLRDAKSSIQAQLSHVLEKSDTDPTDKEKAQEKAEQIVLRLDLRAFDTVEGATVDSMIMVASDASYNALKDLGFKDGSALFGRANANAVAWARENAAALVTEIKDSTRDMLRTTLADAIEKGTPLNQLAASLSDAYAFSDERAQLIARTEIAFANGNGAIKSYEAAAAAGVNVKKEWLLSTEPCEVCIGNALAGAIDLDEEFPSGDETTPAHPNCECTVSPVVIDE